MPRLPVCHDFDLLEPDHVADPYPLLGRVRQETPVAYVGELDAWVVTRYADIESILADPARFSAANSLDPVYPVAPAARAVLAEGFGVSPTMASADPPGHGRVRRHNVRAFSARRLARLEPVIREQAGVMVDRLAGNGGGDLVTGLAYPLPAYIIFTLVGFPAADTELLKSWCGTRTNFTWSRAAADEQVRIAHDMLAYWRYCEQFVAGAAADPRDDFTGDLIRAHRSDPASLSLHEITNIVYGLSFAGHETTTNLIANAIHQLLVHRDQWERLCADPALITGAVEETLRYDTSVVVWRRITTRPVTIGGVDAPSGATLLLLLGAAGRDPAVFADPERFDITRTNARAHLAFGKGIHFCLGAPLSRMELAIVIELLTAHAPDLHLLPGRRIQYHRNISFRGPRQLWVRTHASGANMALPPGDVG